MSVGDYTASLYAEKPDEYFAGTRADIAAMLLENPPGRVLEIGCGSGATGSHIKSMTGCGHYVGLELDQDAAKVAAKFLDRVLVGNVETIDFDRLEDSFDAIILSEVLEHLVDPWSVVAKLYGLMSPKGRIFASSPNIANQQIIRDLLRGKFEYEEFGVMDRTPLRWCTAKSYRKMFEIAGFETVSVSPLSNPSTIWRLFNSFALHRFEFLSSGQIMYVGRVGSS